MSANQVHYIHFANLTFHYYYSLLFECIYVDRILTAYTWIYAN